MIRFILRVFGIKDFEPCSSCENLKQQLEFERGEKKLLIDTLVSIVKPKTVEAAPVEIAPVQQSSALFSRRRAALEEKDRQEAFIIAQQKHLANPDSKFARNTAPITGAINDQIQQLEKELGVEEGV